MLRTAGAFIVRDYLQAISYKFGFCMRLVAIVLGAGILYFISNVFDTGTSSFLKPYGSTYFPFLLIGLALIDFHTLSLQVFSNSIRESQMMGTLEIMLLSPTRLTAIILYSSLWGYLFSSVRFVLYLLTGMLLFGLDLGKANLSGGALVLALSIATFASLGVFIASLIMIIKEAGALDHMLITASLFLAGVPYPIEVLPEWLRQFSVLLPLTHALRAMRHALLAGEPLGRLLPDLGALALFSAILFPLGLWTFHLAVQRVKVTGRLGHY